MGKGRWALGERGRLKASRDSRMRRRDAWMGDVGEGSCTRVVRASRKTGAIPFHSRDGRIELRLPSAILARLAEIILLYSRAGLTLGSNLRFCGATSSPHASSPTASPRIRPSRLGFKQKGPPALLLESLIGTAGFEPATP